MLQPVLGAARVDAHAANGIDGQMAPLPRAGAGWGGPLMVMMLVNRGAGPRPGLATGVAAAATSRGRGGLRVRLGHALLLDRQHTRQGYIFSLAHIYPIGVYIKHADAD